VPPPAGFAWERRKNGDVVITHRGLLADTVRGVAADKLVAVLADADESTVQHALARATGNYRRGNERRPR
jgi:hypothetical protein